MPTGNNLDVSLRAINGGELPSSEEEFINMFCTVYSGHAAHGLSSPFYNGRQSGGDAGVRVRVRTRFQGRKLEVPGVYVRLSEPPTVEQALKDVALDIWKFNEWLRTACGAPRAPAAPVAVASSVLAMHAGVHNVPVLPGPVIAPIAVPAAVAPAVAPQPVSDSVVAVQDAGTLHTVLHVAMRFLPHRALRHRTAPPRSSSLTVCHLSFLRLQVLLPWQLHW